MVIDVKAVCLLFNFYWAVVKVGDNAEEGTVSESRKLKYFRLNDSCSKTP